MGKKKKRHRKRKVVFDKKQKKKNNISLYFHITLTIFLGLLTILFIVLLLIQYDKNKDVNNKIVNIDTINNEMLSLKDNYNDLKEIDDKIDKLNSKNNIINNDINSLKNKIIELESNISKYNK